MVVVIVLMISIGESSPLRRFWSAPIEEVTAISKPRCFIFSNYFGDFYFLQLRSFQPSPISEVSPNLEVYFPLLRGFILSPIAEFSAISNCGGFYLSRKLRRLRLLPKLRRFQPSSIPEILFFIQLQRFVPSPKLWSFQPTPIAKVVTEVFTFSNSGSLIVSNYCGSYTHDSYGGSHLQLRRF